MRPQVILSNMMRPGMTAASFPNPIQRPAVPQASRQPQPRPQRPQATSAMIPTGPVTAVHNPSTNNNQSISNAKLLQRQALLAHTQSFLNPENKPRVKKNVEVSAKDDKIMGADDSKVFEVGGKK